jgi:hypothetical protein
MYIFLAIIHRRVMLNPGSKFEIKNLRHFYFGLDGTRFHLDCHIFQCVSSLDHRLPTLLIDHLPRFKYVLLIISDLHFNF